MTPKTNCDHVARLGNLTASKIADATAKIKTGEAASRVAYRAMLVAERLTGIPQGVDLSNNKAVQWGNEAEPLAKAAFEVETGEFVVEVGFISHPHIPMSGASPDGFLGDDGIIEIKAPNTATHIGYLKANTVPPEYRKQILWQLACTRRKWAKFVSFDPRLNQENQLLIVHFEPMKEEIAELEVEAIAFLKEVEADEQWLRSRGKVVDLRIAA